MRLGRIGGTLVIGGWSLFIVMGAIVAAGGSVGIGARSPGGLALIASFALLGSGAAALSVSGPRPLNRTALRIGLGILAVGFFASLASAIVALLSENDALESIPMIVLLLGGGAASFLGAAVTVVALLTTPGPPRRIGSLFVAGLAALIVASLVAQATLDPLPLKALGMLLAIIGGGAVVVGGLWVGKLAMGVSRPRIVVSA